jgi:hypothetical protein
MRVNPSSVTPMGSVSIRRKSREKTSHAATVSYRIELSVSALA